MSYVPKFVEYLRTPLETTGYKAVSGGGAYVAKPTHKVKSKSLTELELETLAKGHKADFIWSAKHKAYIARAILK